MKNYIYLTCIALCAQHATYATQANMVQQQREVTIAEFQMLQEANIGSLTNRSLQAYLKRGADINVKDELGLTALQMVSRWGRLDAVKALITAGANINIKDNNGSTALIAAACWSRVIAVVQELVAAGADVGLRNEHFKVARDYADDPAAYDKAVAAGLAQRRAYFARQQQAQGFVEAQQQLIPHIAHTVSEYAYGQSPLDLPENKRKEKSKQEEEKK